MSIEKPRDWQLRVQQDGGAYVYTGDELKYPEDDYIEVREVIKGDINDHIIDLIHQRSIAFDEAKKYRELAEQLVEALENFENDNKSVPKTIWKLRNAVIKKYYKLIGDK